MKSFFVKCFAFVLVAFAVTAASATATITIVNVNAPGVGFNDPTPVKKAGGNKGRTLGEQRLIAFQYAANIWGATITSPVEIKIAASFEPLACDASSAVLGSAGTISIFSDFPNAPQPNTWYPAALANKLAGTDLDPANADIRARFNSEIGTPNCLAGIGWYLGLDNDHGTDIDLVTVLLHEFAHGLGFASFIDETKGTPIRGLVDIYSAHLLDTTTGKTWDAMSSAQRKASAINPRNVVWTGQNVLANVTNVLQLGTPLLKELSPTAADYQVGTASFGPAVTAQGVTGPVALANDGTGTITDACEAVPSGSLSGKIALVDRGTCTFVTKALNVQAAGALAMIVADNQPGEPPAGLGGTSTDVTIPSVRVTQTDGATLKSQLPSLTVTLGLDTTLFAGANKARQPYVWTPNPVQPGSSVSHWDVLAFPNQLMEPNINDDLTHDVTVPTDLTFELLKDIGW